MKFCPYCNRKVRPIEERENPVGCVTQVLKFIGFIMLTVVTCGLFLIVYFLAKSFTKKTMVCPICNAKL